jgi:hypothetical protein
VGGSFLMLIILADESQRLVNLYISRPGCWLCFNAHFAHWLHHDVLEVIAVCCTVPSLTRVCVHAWYWNMICVTGANLVILSSKPKAKGAERMMQLHRLEHKLPK